MTPNHHIITREIPKWQLIAFMSFQLGESNTYTNEDKIRVYGVREIVKSDMFDHPYCRTGFTEPYYTSLEELLQDYPDINPTVYDFDNKLLPWKD